MSERPAKKPAVSTKRPESRYRSLRRKRVLFQVGEKTVVLAVSPGFMSFICLLFLVALIVNGAAGIYLFQRDDLIAKNLQNELRIEQSYANKFNNFKTAMETVQSQSADERAKLAERLASLSERQTDFASRTARVAAVIDNARKMGIQVAAVTAPMPMIKPEGPMLADSDLRLGGDETAVGGTLDEDDATLPVDDVLTEEELQSNLTDPFRQIDEYEQSLIEMERLSFVSLHTVRNAITQEHQAYRAALDDLPIDLGLRATETAIGGPFLPVELDEKTIDEASNQIDRQLRDIDKMRDLADDLPLAKPLQRAIRTSSFGRRIDPFRKRAAFHAGVDFRAKTGTPVLATADGKVIRAGRAGGYGNMVEIRHKHGLTTRYAHLHRISVKRGQTVERGQKIGQVGSTGRSTGPHLHYEVRRRGTAKNPQPFMDAGKAVPHL